MSHEWKPEFNTPLQLDVISFEVKNNSGKKASLKDKKIVKKISGKVNQKEI